MFDEKVTVNKHGVNSNIHSRILSGDKMTAAGFHHHSKDAWYYSKLIDKDVTFNVTIKDDNSDFSIDILDEDCLQPYDYQALLHYNPDHRFANKIMEQVEKCMDKLQQSGILYGHVRGEYI